MSEFLTNLDVIQIGENDWKLAQALIYASDVYGGKVEVPSGFRTDFASVPRVPLAYMVAGNTAQKASVPHDFLYQTHLCERAMADLVFLEAMEVTGIPLWRRRIMYSAVRMFGWIAYRSGKERHAKLGNSTAS